MNVYQKLNEARKRFHAQKLKKSGRNTFANYDYFELGDFLIPAMQVFEEVGLCGLVSFPAGVANMRVVNVEAPEEVIVFEAPMGSAALKGCHDVQNLGAVETYQRRYMWVKALEIVEHDALEATTGKPGAKEETPHKIGGMFQPDLDDIASYMVEQHEAGQDLEAIRVWYSEETFSKDSSDQNDEKMYIWNALKPYSKLRSAIKANKPAPEPVQG